MILIALVLLMISAPTARSAWDTRWDQDHTDLAQWMIAEVYSGTVERCWIANITPPRYTNSYDVYAGTTNVAVTLTNIVGNTTNVSTFTNYYPTYVSVQKVNQEALGPFVHTAGSVTTTNVPAISRQFLQHVTDKLELAIPAFMDIGEPITVTVGVGDNWGRLGCDGDGRGFELGPVTNATQVYPAFNQPVKFTKEELFRHAGIGIITNGLVEWTAHAETQYQELLGMALWNGTQWQYVDHNQPPSNQIYDPTKRVKAAYYKSGTGTLTSVSVDIYGRTSYVTSSTPFSVTAGVKSSLSFSSTTTQSSNKAYFDVTNMVVSGSGTYTGDVVAVFWDDVLTRYGDLPNTLQWVHLKERQLAVDALVKTTTGLNWVSKGEDNSTFYDSPNKTNWTEAVDAMDVDTTFSQNGRPLKYFRGRITGAFSHTCFWRAEAGNRYSYASYDTTITTNLTHNADIYALVMRPSIFGSVFSLPAVNQAYLESEEWAFNTQGVAGVPDSDALELIQTMTNIRGNTTNTVAYGDSGLSEPAQEAADPAESSLFEDFFDGFGDLVTAKGWVIHRGFIVLDWERENGIYYR